MARSPERRASPRCNAVQNQSRIELPVSQGRRTVEARLVNISRHGALIVADNLPCDATQIRLRVVTPVKSDWVEARIVRRSENHEIGLKFPRRCPVDLLVAASVGTDLTSMFFRGGTCTPTFD